MSVFLKFREHFTDIVIVDSVDYSSENDRLSYIAMDSLFTKIRLLKGNVIENRINGFIEYHETPDEVRYIKYCLASTLPIHDSLYSRYFV